MSSAGIQSWTFSAIDNSTINGIVISENCPAANINNSIRQLMSSVLMEIAYQGTDISASASMSLAGVDWRYMAVTGSASVIHVGTGRAGLVRVTKWNSASTLVNSSNMLLDGAANIVVATNDVTVWTSFGSGVWRGQHAPISGLPPAFNNLVTASATIGDTVFAKTSGGVSKLIPAGITASAGTLIVWDTGPKYPAGDGSAITNIGSSTVFQIVNTQTGAVATGTTQIPGDDTIPQNTEGNQYMSLAITPTSAAHNLKIEVRVVAATSAAPYMIAALFQDTTADALAAAPTSEGSPDRPTAWGFTHYMTAGTTSATTFKVRIGGTGAATTTFNGAGGARLLGGVMSSSITITEYI